MNASAQAASIAPASLDPPSAHATFVYMSETVGIAELRQNLSKYLRKVAEGERLVVTDRNRPVAELAPPPTTGSRLDQLIAEGKVKPPKRRGPLPAPMKMDLPFNALTRALEEVRGYR
jgi:prevent-host-death family protein